MKIEEIHGREIFDSRGNPTVEVEVTLEDGSYGSAIVPSGASTGVHEAHELRDGDNSRFKGMGVLKAVDNVNNEIGRVLVGMDAEDQKSVDQKMIELDGTENKKRLGANAILAVSMAVAQAQAIVEDQWLFEYLSKFNPQASKHYRMPVPLINVINGGRHAPDGVDMQEFMIVPNGAKTFKEAMKMGIETFHTLKSIIKERGFVTLVGDEGGFAPPLHTNEGAIKLLIESIEKSGYRIGVDISIAMDPATSEFFQGGSYNMKKEGVNRSEDEMINYWAELLTRYPIVSLEDLLEQEAWSGWRKVTERIGNKVQIVGDDFLVTNTKRLRRAIDDKCANSILVKVNQIGTLTEAIDAINMAQGAGWSAIVSHRSGDSEDTFIADLVVALATGQIKTGSASRSERIAKYNQLLRIEEYLGDNAHYVDPFKKKF